MNPTSEMTSLSPCPMGVARGTQHRDGSDVYVAKESRPPRVLVVDDEPNLLELRRVLLERFGYHVIVAPSGQQALEIFRRTAVDVIILDYLMPGMNGGQTAREIRDLDPVIPIILSSASNTVFDVNTELFTASVPKGSHPRCLLETLKDQLQRVCRDPRQPCQR